MKYPHYMKTKDGIVAVTSPDEMFLITNQGRNTNAGVSIDMFITRRMVLKHAKYGQAITREEFTRIYKELFETTLKLMLP